MIQPHKRCMLSQVECLAIGMQRRPRRKESSESCLRSRSSTIIKKYFRRSFLVKQQSTSSVNQSGVLILSEVVCFVSLVLRVLPRCRNSVRKTHRQLPFVSLLWRDSTFGACAADVVHSRLLFSFEATTCLAARQDGHGSRVF